MLRRSEQATQLLGRLRRVACHGIGRMQYISPFHCSLCSRFLYCGARSTRADQGSRHIPDSASVCTSARWRDRPERSDVGSLLSLPEESRHESDGDQMGSSIMPRLQPPAVVNPRFFHCQRLPRASPATCRFEAGACEATAQDSPADAVQPSPSPRRPQRRSHSPP